MQKRSSQVASAPTRVVAYLPGLRTVLQRLRATTSTPSSLHPTLLTTTTTTTTTDITTTEFSGECQQLGTFQCPLSSSSEYCAVFLVLLSFALQMLCTTLTWPPPVSTHNSPFLVRWVSSLPPPHTHLPSLLPSPPPHLTSRKRNSLSWQP